MPISVLESDHSELGRNDLLHVDAVLEQPTELGADLGGLVGGLNQGLELSAGHDLDNGTEDGAVLHLLLEQGAQLLLGQDGDDGVQKTVQSSGGALGHSYRQIKILFPDSY